MTTTTIGMMMMIKYGLIAGTVGLGLALLSLPGQTDQPGGGVVLNRAPPVAPSWGLDWATWQLSGRRPFAAPAADPAPAPAAVPATADIIAEGEGWEDAAYAGVWATPAEFSDSD